MSFSATTTTETTTTTTITTTTISTTTATFAMPIVTLPTTTTMTIPSKPATRTIAMHSPISARRVRTDLQTSENIFLLNHLHSNPNNINSHVNTTIKNSTCNDNSYLHHHHHHHQQHYRHHHYHHQPQLPHCNDVTCNYSCSEKYNYNHNHDHSHSQSHSHTQSNHRHKQTQSQNQGMHHVSNNVKAHFRARTASPIVIKSHNEHSSPKGTIRQQQQQQQQQQRQQLLLRDHYCNNYAHQYYSKIQNQNCSNHNRYENQHIHAYGTRSSNIPIHSSKLKNQENLQLISSSLPNQNSKEMHFKNIYSRLACEDDACRATGKPHNATGSRHLTALAARKADTTATRQHILSTSAPFSSVHLPARATRLLNRSRLQQQCSFNADSPDSSKSAHSARRSAAASRASSNCSSAYQQATRPGGAGGQQQQANGHRDSFSSSDDLMLHDKSFRNAMIQDVLMFKKQLLRLRHILQETETINPFDLDNGQLLANCGVDIGKDSDLNSLTSSMADDPMQELADLRRQVVYLQGQVDDRDRTIRQQKSVIDKLEVVPGTSDLTKECTNTATQTERVRPLSIGPERLSRSKPEFTSYTTYFPAVSSDDKNAIAAAAATSTIFQYQQMHPNANNPSVIPHQAQMKEASQTQHRQQLQLEVTRPQQVPQQTRRHTIISTTLTNYNTKSTAQKHTSAATATTPRRASISLDKETIVMPYKPMRITLIGDPLKQWYTETQKQQQQQQQLFSSNDNISKDVKNTSNNSTAAANTNDHHENNIQHNKHNIAAIATAIASEATNDNIFNTKKENHQRLPNRSAVTLISNNQHSFDQTPLHRSNGIQKPTVTIV